jgi:hypothetical protein
MVPCKPDCGEGTVTELVNDPISAMEIGQDRHRMETARPVVLEGFKSAIKAHGAGEETKREGAVAKSVMLPVLLELPRREWEW